MTSNPQAAFAVCACSHTQRRHFEHEGACQAAACGCGAFRDPAAAVPEPEPPATLAAVPDIEPEPAAEEAPVARVDIESAAPPVTTCEDDADVPDVVIPVMPRWMDVLSALQPWYTDEHESPVDLFTAVMLRGLDSDVEATQSLTVQVAQSIIALSERLVDEAEVYRVRLEIARLEAQLETQRQKLAALAGDDQPAVPGFVPKVAGDVRGELVDMLGRSFTTGDYPCGDCEQRFPSRQGLVMHGRRAHGNLQGDPRARSSRTADES